MEENFKERRSCQFKPPHCLREYSSDYTTQVKKKSDEKYILNSFSDMGLIKPEYIKMSQYRTKCLQCKTITRRVRTLLNELRDIKITEGFGVCEYCKHTNTSGNCKRCEYLANKSICCKADQQQDNEGVFESWINKVKNLLKSILECENVCCPKLFKEPTSLDELEKLLRELSSPLPMRQPDISYFLQAESGHFDFVSLTPGQSLTEGQSLTQGHDEHIKKRSSAKSLEGIHSVLDIKQKSVEKILTKKQSTKSIPSKAQTVSQQIKSNKNTFTIVTSKSTTSSLPTLPSHPFSSSRERKKKTRNETQKNLPEFSFSLPSLPVPFEKTSKHSGSSLESESVIECDTHVGGPSVLIKGTALVKVDQYKDEPQPGVVPLSYKVDAVFSVTEIDSNSINSSIKSKNMGPEKMALGGFIYKLSDQAFIAKGWTVLPTTKVLKEINIYKMKPACPQLDWFENHKTKKNMFYGSGEKLAEFIDDGHSRLFYKNGAIAMNYYRTEDMNEGRRYIVYGSDGEVVNKKKGAPPFLARFDYAGNGIVYDKYGNERLKYNQSEGVLYDEKIGPPTHWLWHSLNDDPVMKSIVIETFVKDRGLHKLICKENFFGDGEANTHMIEIEGDCLEKSREFFKKCKPYHIRAKIFKINDQFSLRLFDQANIYLLFRDGPISLKFNLGMKFIDTEIIGTEIADATLDVPLSFRPAHTSVQKCRRYLD